MKSMRIYLVFWVSGMIAGVVLMERWRRRGGQYVPVEAVPLAAVEAPPAAASTASVVGQVVAGARLDAERVVRRLRPPKST